jgi:hypothetical protein
MARRLVIFILTIWEKTCDDSGGSPGRLYSYPWHHNVSDQNTVQNFIISHTRMSSTLKCLAAGSFNSPRQRPKEVSIWFGHTFRKSHSIANRPDFYAVEEWYPASFVQTVCGRRCIGRRKSDRCSRGGVQRAEDVRLPFPLIARYPDIGSG